MPLIQKKTRNPNKTAINKAIKTMTEELRAMLPSVLAETGIAGESSINAIIGGKAAEFIDLHHEQIHSPEHYVELYMKGFNHARLKPGRFSGAYDRNFRMFKQSPAAQKYFLLFLKRSFLKHYDELARKRPELSESEIWIGQNNLDYGLLITPRFRNGTWENDKSEIRHFPKLYWTVGHAIQSGLVIDGDQERIEFRNVNDYLVFFKNTLVRASGSQYERAIADNYVKYVRESDDPESIPLLIPEYRYGGRDKAHKYRLDFTVINPFTMDKVAFELSPWSTHGYLKKIHGLTQAKINEMARDNFEKEMERHRSFFKKHNIFALIYTDKDLANIDGVFEEIAKYLRPVNRATQLDFHLLDSFFK